MKKVSLRAYAKINLGLDVLGTLPDGYHEVRMVMQNIGIYDKVSLTQNNSGEVKLKCNLKFLSEGADNIAYKAARLILDRYAIPDGVDIDLYKYIPVAAGMAGGSTDAAAVLKGMNKLFGLGLSTEELMRLGKELGADVPYCVLGGTALAEGIGEKLTRLSPCPESPILIAKPAISVSTRYVYDNLVLNSDTVHPDIDGIIAAIEAGDIKGVAARLGNVLEDVTIKAHPVIADIKRAMTAGGAYGVLMSGSGPTVFGMFSDEREAKECAAELRRKKLACNTYVTGIVTGENHYAE